MNKLLVCVVLVGCAETAAPARSGPLITEVSHEVRVCQDGAAFREGGRVRFQRAICHTHPKLMTQRCLDLETGVGQVLRVLDDKCALVLVPADSDVRAGDEISVEPVVAR